MQDLHIVLYTLQYGNFHGAEKENLSNNQKFLEFIIIIFCYSCDLNASFKGDTVGGNWMLFTRRG